MEVDYLIVGSGLTGATIARTLTDNGLRVLVLERRAHLGGNVFDHHHPSGIRVHTYGPHYFRTSSEELWRFVARFAELYPYEACVKSLVDGRHESWPIAGSYIRRVVGERWEPGFTGEPANFEEASLKMMPRPVYEKFVKGYTEKQWGVPARALSARLAGRFDVREDDDPRLFRKRFQGIPRDGYATLMRNMLAGIPVLLNVDYLAHRQEFGARKLLVFTGPIDELFRFDLGRLVYRGQRREERYLPDVDWYQPSGQVNNPDPANGPSIRTLEWKHMLPPETAERIRGTVITTETTVTPSEPDHYEYPFPDDANQALYARYRERAASLDRTLVCGRLGEYRYYDMDQAIGRAQLLAAKILAGVQPSAIMEG